MAVEVQTNDSNFRIPGRSTSSWGRSVEIFTSQEASRGELSSIRRYMDSDSRKSAGADAGWAHQLTTSRGKSSTHLSKYFDGGFPAG